jgi:hypothetical protein
MKFRFQIGSNSPLAKRRARMFCAASLPEEVVDAEDLRFVERLVHLRVELDRALQVGSERLLHDHPGVLDELRLPQHVDHIERGGGRHAEVVQPQAALAELVLRLGDRGRQRLLARRPRHVAQVRGELLHSSDTSCSRIRRSKATVLRWPYSAAAALANARKSSSLISSRDDPTILNGGASCDAARCAKPGSSFRRARSPVAPKSTITWGRMRSDSLRY